MDDNSASRVPLIRSDEVEVLRPKAQRQWITVEPMVLLLFFSFAFSGTILTNLYLTHTCEVILNFNHSMCSHLGVKKSPQYHDLEKLVQPHVTMILMSKTLLEACIPAALSFFLGPWSDLHGRKPLLIWATLGYTLMYFLYLGASLMPKLHPGYLLFASLPLSLCGGAVAVFSGMYSYISDVSSSKKRSLRMGMVDVCFFGGMLMGSSSSSFVFAAAGEWGYVAIFGIGGTCCFLAFLYCTLILPESVERTQGVRRNCCFGRDLFQLQHVKDVFRTATKVRSNQGRTLILCIIFALASFVSTFEGEGSVAFLFARNKFNWTIEDYTLLMSLDLVIAIGGMLLGTSILSTWLEIPDAPLVAFGYFCKTVSAVLVALSPVYWYLYAAIALSVSSCLVGPLSRSLLTKIVPRDEVGKVFSLVASLEALGPLAANPLYTVLYNETLNTFPGAFMFLSAAIFSFDTICILTVIVIQHLKGMYGYEEMGTSANTL